MEDIKDVIKQLYTRGFVIDSMLLELNALSKTFERYLETGIGDHSKIMAELDRVTTLLENSPITKLVNILEKE